MNSTLTVSRANLLLEQTVDCSAAVRTTLPRDELRHQLELHRSHVDLNAEHSSIPLASSTSRTANVPESSSSEVIPYDVNRVVLPPTLANPTGYYNASMIDVACLRHRRLRHRQLQRPGGVGSSEWTSRDAVTDASDAFVTAASPIGPNLRSEFWRVVWHSAARVVARVGPALTNTCCLGNEERFVCDGGLHVGLVAMGSADSCTGGASSAKLVRLTSGRLSRDIWLLDYTGGWSRDGRVPASLREFLTFLDELDALRRALQLQRDSFAENDDSAGKVEESLADEDSSVRQTVRLLLHCSDGASHCGLTLTALVYRACLQYNLPLSLPTVLCALRGQRMRLVACPRQYRFVYDAVIESLEDTRLI